MIELIIQIVLILGYIVFCGVYIVKQMNQFQLLAPNTSQTDLQDRLISGFRNVMLLHIVMIIIASILLMTGVQTSLLPPQIGLILAIGTVVFYGLFMTWDILKYKINLYVEKKHGYSLQKHMLFNKIIAATIAFSAILILEMTIAIVLILK